MTIGYKRHADLLQIHTGLTCDRSSYPIRPPVIKDASAIKHFEEEGATKLEQNKLVLENKASRGEPVRINCGNIIRRDLISQLKPARAEQEEKLKSLEVQRW